MRIGLISDTHDRLPTIRWALERFAAAGVRTLVHPGDLVAPFAAKLLAEWNGVVHVTYGNNDGERAGLKRVLPQIQDGPLHVEIGGRRLLVHHFVDWCRPEDVERAEIIVSGHTHERGVSRLGDKLFVNPGECCGWVTGTATVALLETDTGEVEWLEAPT
ncbi:MAG: metallophosphoesterase [Planctomycetota bacterium]|nr:MAG: metallophosphoesterase [Planctomycetota bacterium]